MKYSFEFKENIVKKVLSGRKVKEVAKESGVTDWSIYQWKKQFNNGNIKTINGQGGINLQRKYDLINESKNITEDNIGEWLRKNGLHSGHLIKWKEDIMNALSENSNEKKEIKNLQEENKKLRKELNRKEKALSEAAVLLTLKKKFIHLWEDEEK